VRIEKFDDGYAFCADSTVPGLRAQVRELTGDVPLIVADPPYGNILPVKWDNYQGTDEDQFTDWMIGWTRVWSACLLPNAAFYVWGGIGTPGFRPFFRYLSQIERESDIGLNIANLITWKKKRAYGIQHNYLFTREECVYLFKGDDIKKPRCFNVPLLEEKRGYAGYNKKYPAKSDHFRRTNVWTDVTEVMRGKVHDAQKAQRVIEVPIEVHTKPGEWVIDPFAWSGTTALAARKLGRKFVVIEKDEETFENMVYRLHTLRELDGGGWVVSNHATPDSKASA
jgi:site-specific DNA-methyltransferase (adenine-specific)